MAILMLDDPVSKYTNPKLVTVDVGVSVQTAAKEMVEAKVDSILVFTNYNVIGIVTMKDIFAKIIAMGKDAAKIDIGALAQRKIIKINKDATVREAIDLMKKNDIRRLVVWSDERAIGIITQKAIVGNMSEFSVPIPELEIPDKVKCPYCASQFDNKKTLCSHIDDIHIGKNLFDGDIDRAVVE